MNKTKTTKTVNVKAAPAPAKRPIPSAPTVTPAPVATKPQSAPNRADEAINKRITLAPTKVWRIVRGQRKEKFGKYLLQGGAVTERGGREYFAVGAEETYDSLDAARAALAAKQPKPAAA
jgi:hypothetical protein